MTGFFRYLLIVCALGLLAGCKVELYSNLSEQEANEMLALLMLRDISVNKQTIKGGTVSIKVESSQFSEAIEVLRQHGLPRKSTRSMEDLFPSGQLVTSPTQEQTKILFLKEQQLEAMLSSMTGVINAQVSVAESTVQSRRDKPVLSASVLVKYSPDRNIGSREANIRALVQKGVPNLKAENISVVMEPAEYRYRPQAATPLRTAENSNWLARNRIPLAASLGIISLICLALYTQRQRNRWPRLKKL